MSEQKKPAKDEGPRSFTRALEMLAGGECQQQAAEELHALLRKLSDEATARQSAVTGELTLTLKIKVDRDKTAEVVHAVKTKAPQKRTQRSVLWLTPGGNLVPENPRQQSLGAS